MIIHNTSTKSEKFEVKFIINSVITKDIWYYNNVNDSLLNIINKYLKVQLSDEKNIFPFSKHIISKVLYKYNIIYIDISEFIYMLNKFNYKNKNILVCSANLNHMCALEFIKEHYNKSINYNSILLEKYTRFPQYIYSNLEHFNKIYPNRNISIYNNNITQLSDLDNILTDIKYDYIILDNFNTNSEVYKYNVYSHKYLLYNAMLFLEPLIINIYILLHNLQKNGNGIIFCRLPHNYAVLELLYFISTKFKTIKFEKSIYLSTLTTYIICNGFNGLEPKDLNLINNIYNKFRKIYPENINKNSLDILLNKSIGTILNLGSRPPFIDFLGKYYRFENGVINYINNLIDEAIYLQYEIKNNNKEIIKLYEQKHLADTISIAKMIDIELLPRLEEKIFKDKFGQTILTNIYSFDNYIYYKFYKHPIPSFKIHVKLDIPLYIFEKLPNKFNLATRIIDTRNVRDYNNIKIKIRHYEKSLSKYVENNYTHNKKATRAFLKMYEILETTNIINPNIKNINVFCIAEAPGSFIISLNHYIKTKTDIINYNWVGQSLNSKEKIQDSFGLGDMYKLMYKYPNNWDFGNKGTGDILDIDNIIYYRNTYKDKSINLVTADGGIGYVNTEDYLSDRLIISELIIMLSILKKCGNFVLKIYLPCSHPIYISMFYLLYTRFKQFQIYKTFQNAWSCEFYIIGINYIEPINDNEFNELLNLLKDFDINKTIIPLRNIPESFLLQLNSILNELINSFKIAILKVIYYVDNIHDMKKNDIDKLNISIETKNKNWANMFKIKKIDKNNLIH